MDAEDLNEIQNFFNGMGWPMPEKGEYYEGTGDRYLAFLTEYGVIVRLTPEQSVIEEENPHFILPLFNRQAGAYRINIDPGYDCPVTSEEMRTIYRMLSKKFGVRVHDAKRHNLCFVPHTEPRYPVVIDLDPEYTLVRFEETPAKTSGWSAERAICLLNADNAVNPQIEIYAPLRRIIDEAWPPDCDRPDPEGIAAFKSLCKAFKAEGKLVAPWGDRRNSYSGPYGGSLRSCSTTQAAEMYARKLAAFEASSDFWVGHLRFG